MSKPEGEAEREPTASALPESWLRRTWLGAGAAARLASSALVGASAAASSTAEAVQTLGRLKGAMMKVGQMASFMQGALPSNLQAALVTLQDSAPPMPAELVSDVIRSELGAPPEELFAWFASEPAAAASIGQVHRARTHDGCDVAVKVQYPGVSLALGNDLRNVDWLAALAGPLAPQLDVKALRDEVRSQLQSECDYTREAENQRDFARRLAGVPRVRVPAVVDTLCSARVLTSEWQNGQRYAKFVAEADPAARDLAGVTIFDFAFRSIFRFAVFNCDPHPGNYLFDGPDVVFLDFGCVRRFSPGFVAGWRGMIESVLHDRRREFDQWVRDLGIAGRHDFDFDYHYAVSRELYRPFLCDEPFVFSHEYISTLSAQLYAKNPNKRRARMPAEFLFVNRLQWGLYSVLAGLSARANWHRVFVQALGERVEPAAPRPSQPSRGSSPAELANAGGLPARLSES